MGLAARKTVCGFSDKARLKPVSSATETSQKVEISLEACLHIILANKPITKALIRLRICAGLSAPLLFATLLRQVLLRRSPYMSQLMIFWYSFHRLAAKFLMHLSIHSVSHCIFAAE